MIKKLTDKEYNRRDTKYAMMFGLGSVFFVLSILSFTDIFNFIGSVILCLGIYGLPVAIVGLIFHDELQKQRDNPENFVYCKKCKSVIRKKHIFCSSCRQSIKRTISSIEDKKCIKDYKKFYKEKDKKK